MKVNHYIILSGSLNVITDVLVAIKVYILHILPSWSFPILKDIFQCVFGNSKWQVTDFDGYWTDIFTLRFWICRQQDTIRYTRKDYDMC